MLYFEHTKIRAPGIEWNIPGGKGGRNLQLRQTLRDFARQADLVLLVLCTVSTLFGIVIIASATRHTGSDKFVVVQSAGMLLGILFYFILSSVDVEDLPQKWKWILGFNIVLFLLLRTPLGIEVNGNRAWLGPQTIGKMLGISALANFPITLQPAEVVKITYTILLAWQFAKLREERDLKALGNVIQPAAHMLFMVALLYVMSRDAGSALVYVMIFLGMSFAAGMSLRWYAIGGVAAGVGFWAMWHFKLLPSHMRSRIAVLFDHELDPMGAGWHQGRSILALGSGQATGQGLFSGTQTQSSYSSSLPERYNDFIFSALGEELGMVGCVVALLLLCAIVLRCFSIARSAKTAMSAYVAVGMASMLLFQILANIGMCLYVMPVIGLTLPFFSYGGTSVVMMYAAMGIVSGIKKRSLPDWLRT